MKIFFFDKKINCNFLNETKTLKLTPTNLLFIVYITWSSKFTTHNRNKKFFSHSFQGIIFFFIYTISIKGIVRQETSSAKHIGFTGAIHSIHCHCIHYSLRPFFHKWKWTEFFWCKLKRNSVWRRRRREVNCFACTWPASRQFSYSSLIRNDSLLYVLFFNSVSEKIFIELHYIHIKFNWN